MDITQVIAEAVANRGLAPGSLRDVILPGERDIVAEVKRQFVTGSPRTWWLGLKHRTISRHYPGGDGVNHLADFVPASEQRMWFIPETGAEDLPVYDAELSAIVEVVNNCPFFEYYMVGQQLRWLLIENDHNELIFVSAQ